MSGDRRALRTKSGCFTCRARRKKCDERRPVCLGCERNTLACDWPMFENQTLRDYRKHTLKLIPRPEVRSPSPEQNLLFQELNISFQEKSSLEFISGPFVKVMCPTPAADSIRGHIKDQILRDEVFRKISICLGNFLNPSFGTDEHQKLLKDALDSFRAHLFPSEADMVNVDTLHSVSFLNLLEMIESKPSISKVILHMQTMFQIICTIISGGSYLDNPVFRVCADSYFYNYGLVLICLSNKESDSLPNVFSVIAIWKSIYLNEVHNYDLNPMLGNKFVSISFINRACYIFRCKLVERRTLAYSLRLEIENTLRTKELSQHQEMLVQSAKMLILKVAYPKEGEVFAQKREFTRKCLDYLLTLVAVEEDFTIFWAFFICGLCVSSEIEKNDFRNICWSGKSSNALQNSELPLLGLIEKAWATGKGLEVLNDEKFAYELHDILATS